MKKTILSLALVVFSLLGIFDAGYVTYETYSGVVPSCIPPFQCGVVLNSSYSKLLGIPLSLYGLFFYATVFVLAMMNVTESKIKIPVTKNVRRTLYLLTTFGFFFSLYLMFLQQFVIKAWCLWCLISAITTTSLFAISMLLKASEKNYLSEE